MSTRAEALVIAKAAFRIAEKGHNLQYVLGEIGKAYPDTTPEPLWQSNRYTDEERSTFIELRVGEIRDDLRGVAESQLDGEEQLELDGYIIDPEDFRDIHQWSENMDHTIEPDEVVLKRAVELGLFEQTTVAGYHKVRMTDYGRKFWERYL